MPRVAAVEAQQLCSKPWAEISGSDKSVCFFSLLVIFMLDIIILATVGGERKENWIHPEHSAIPRFLKAGSLGKVERIISDFSHS